MNIDIIVGARPNFIKIAPIIEAIHKEQEKGTNIHFRLVHTGQHYDDNLSGEFFRQLQIPKPDINLEVGSGSQAEQTAKIMIRYEQLLLSELVDICLVVGDVTSTMACAIVAKKMGLKVAHVEAGIRSFDLTMPEEINRMVTDSITDYFFTTSIFANKNLSNMGVRKDQIYYVGNTMIDSLLKQMPKFSKPTIYNELHLKPKKYLVMTMHRPNNVDEINKLEDFLITIDNNVKDYPVLFPVHPRTENILQGIKVMFQCIVKIRPMPSRMLPRCGW